MNKVYDIYLDGELIGITHLEKSDAPMGIVFGKIRFNGSEIDYKFIKNYCKTKNIALTDDYPEDKLLSTKTIDSLSVRNSEGIEIKGTGNQISGMDNDGFEIIVEGVSYPFYEEEFPHHINK